MSVGVDQAGQQFQPLALRRIQVGVRNMLVLPAAERAQCAQHGVLPVGSNAPRNLEAIRILAAPRDRKVAADTFGVLGHCGLNLGVGSRELRGTSCAIAQPCAEDVRRHRQALSGALEALNARPVDCMAPLAILAPGQPLANGHGDALAGHPAPLGVGSDQAEDVRFVEHMTGAVGVGEAVHGLAAALQLQHVAHTGAIRTHQAVAHAHALDRYALPIGAHDQRPRREAAVAGRYRRAGSRRRNAGEKLYLLV